MTIMTKDLTDKQLNTLHAIEKFIFENGMSPTLAELHPILGVSSNQSIINHLNVLEEKGFIERKKTARGIRITKLIKDNEESSILELLEEIRARKSEQKNNNVSIPYSVPLNSSEEAGKVIEVSYDNEQY